MSRNTAWTYVFGLHLQLGFLFGQQDHFFLFALQVLNGLLLEQTEDVRAWPAHASLSHSLPVLLPHIQLPTTLTQRKARRCLIAKEMSELISALIWGIKNGLSALPIRRERDPGIKLCLLNPLQRSGAVESAAFRVPGLTYEKRANWLPGGESWSSRWRVNSSLDFKASALLFRVWSPRFLMESTFIIRFTSGRSTGHMLLFK